jgi:type III pantothenate kinase
MNQNQTVFIVDAGNTFIKVGRFYNDELIQVSKFTIEELSELTKEINLVSNARIFISSVLTDIQTNELVKSFKNSILFTRKTRLPITIGYETFETLGLDRICNAVASFFFAKNKNAVSIDLGTCIKFDFIDDKGIFQGGSISPGIQLRYSSMNDYTGKLPLITDRLNSELIGKNTLNSLRSGVMNGIQGELDQFMKLYTQQYQDLTFFVTGGDAVYFDFDSKNNTFVDQNLTLKGLYQIFLFNAK